MYKPPRTPRRQLALSLQLVADELDDLLWDFTLETEDRARFYSFRIYDPGRPLEPDTLYILNPSKESCRYFPASDYPYLSIGDWEGAAEHICVRGQDFLAVVNILSHIFQRFRDFEAELNWILNHGGDLDTLCAAATAYLQNPVYLHDSVFAILALPCHVEGKTGFKIAVLLPRGTNLPLNSGKEGEDRMLTACNKWLLAHPDSEEAGNGAYIGLTGENLILS